MKQLDNIGMVLAPTVRSNAYLQGLLKAGYKPSFILLLDDGQGGSKPGQASVKDLEMLKAFDLTPYFDPEIAITDLVEQYELEYKQAGSRDINDPMVIELIAGRKEEYFVYSGFGGVILGKGIIGCGKKFLHMHSGAVPDYRGSTTTYYHLLDGDQCYVSAFFLDEEIDTGPVIKVKAYPRPPDGRLIDYIYDAHMRADLMAEVIGDYVKTGQFAQLDVNYAEGETYFIIHPVLKHIAILSCEND